MNVINLTTFPVLSTERLVLRSLVEADAPAILRLRSDEEVNRWLNRPPTGTLDDALQFIQKIEAGTRDNRSVYWVICLKEDSEVIGAIGLWNFDMPASRAEIGYELLPSFHGKGIMMEALEKVVEYGFTTLQLELITAMPFKDNIASIKLLEKKGFVHNQPLEKEMPAEELEEGCLVYSISRTENNK